MVQRTSAATAALYEVDETAWLEATAEAAETGMVRGTFPQECPWDLDGVLADRGEDAEPSASA